MDKTQQSIEVTLRFKTKVDELYLAYSRGIITQVEKMVKQADLIHEYSLMLGNIWFNPDSE